MQPKRVLTLEELYAIAIVAVVEEHPHGLNETQLEIEATDWLLAAKQVLEGLAA